MGEDKIALYNDDVLLFLGDTDSSLVAAMDIVEEFGWFSGLVINWDESASYAPRPIKKSHAAGNFPVESDG